MAAIIAGAMFAAFSRQASATFLPMEITYVSCMPGAIVFSTINVVRHLCKGDILSYFSPFCSIENLIGFAFLGICSTIAATALGNFALSRIQMTTIAAFQGISTLVTILIGVIFEGEQLFYYHFIGLSLIMVRMIGVSAISIVKDKRRLVLK